MARPKRDLTRITINLPTHVLQRIDDYALKHGTSRTTAIMLLCADSLAQIQNEENKNTASRIWDETTQRYI